MYIVTVEFTIRPERMQAFMPLMVDNARASRSLEPGSRQFDVCLDPAAPNNLATAHFKTFDAAVRDMVAAKVVRTYIRSDPK